MLKNFSKIQLALLTILVVATVFLRFWQIRDYVVFLGDEGRDMSVMRKMILQTRPVFLGPTASVGGFYLGPIYYWMAAPFLALTRFDPVGPSIMVAIFGVGTVLLLFKFLRETVGFYPAILASSLYATAPLIVRYSRSSWNPNPLPFFALLMIYFVYLAISAKKSLFYLLAGACFGVLIQLHYLSIMILPVVLLIVLLNTKVKTLPKIVLLCVLGAVVTFSPFLIFEIKHNFPNFRTIIEFVTRPSTHGYSSFDLPDMVQNYGNIFFENLSQLYGTVITKMAFLIIAALVIFSFCVNYKSKEKRLIYSIGLFWFLGGLVFIKFYTGQIFDYYYGFMFPAPFFAFGIVSAQFWQNIKARYLIIGVTAICILWFLSHEFYVTPPNRLINQTESVADFVIAKTEGKPFNFALMSDHNSDHAYRYFLDINGNKPTELETMITDQLLVICEAQKCEPLGYPTWEIAGFGRAEIQGQWELPNIGISVFRLTHWPGVPNPAGKPAVKGSK